MDAALVYQPELKLGWMQKLCKHMTTNNTTFIMRSLLLPIRMPWAMIARISKDGYHFELILQELIQITATWLQTHCNSIASCRSFPTLNSSSGSGYYQLECLLGSFGCVGLLQHLIYHQAIAINK